MEKKQIKISLCTFIVCMIILVCIIVAMAMYIVNQNKSTQESKIVTANAQKESQQGEILQNNTTTTNTTNIKANTTTRV